MNPEFLEVEPGVFSILVNGRSYEARVDGSAITIGGQRYGVEHKDPRKWNRGENGALTHGRDNIKAPMPGKIVRVLVEVGEEVTAGHGIVVVEAMKMQNEMKSARTGRVASINVRANDTVEAGAVLAVIE